MLCMVIFLSKYLHQHDKIKIKSVISIYFNFLFKTNEKKKFRFNKNFDTKVNRLLVTSSFRLFVNSINKTISFQF